MVYELLAVAREAYQGAELRDILSLVGGHRRRICCNAPQVSYPSDIRSADIACTNQCRQLSLHHTAGRGCADIRAVCQIHSQRQYLAWCDTRALLNIAEQEPPQAPQYVHLSAGIISDDRLWRLGGS